MIGTSLPRADFLKYCKMLIFNVKEPIKQSQDNKKCQYNNWIFFQGADET